MTDDPPLGPTIRPAIGGRVDSTRTGPVVPGDVDADLLSPPVDALARRAVAVLRPGR